MRVLIRRLTNEDQEAFLAAMKRSRTLHGRWVMPPKTPKAFAAYVKRYSGEGSFGSAVVHRDTGEIVGVINLNNIVRGAFQNAYLGYYAFAPHAGQGFMREGMLLVMREAFKKLKLHRLEAFIQPGNLGSIGLVKSCGFVKEGLSRRCLKVHGHWCDHERWVMLKENYRPVR